MIATGSSSNWTSLKVDTMNTVVLPQTEFPKGKDAEKLRVDVNHEAAFAPINMD